MMIKDSSLELVDIGTASYYIERARLLRTRVMI